MKDGFPARLKRAMNHKGIRSVDLAKKIGVSSGYVSNLVTGRIDRPHRHLKSICDELGVSEEWLMFGFGVGDRSLDTSQTVDVYRVDNGTLKLYSEIRLHWIELDRERDLFGILIESSDVIEEGGIALVSKSTGSGQYLCEDQGKIIIAYREDKITTSTWVYLGGGGFNIESINVLGKLKCLFNYKVQI